MKQLKNFFSSALHRPQTGETSDSQIGVDPNAFGRCFTFPDRVKRSKPPNVRQRMNVYLSHLKSLESAHFVLSGSESACPISVNTTLDEFLELVARRQPKGRVMSERSIKSATQNYQRYVVQLQKLLAQAKIDDPVLLVHGDNRTSHSLPVAVKSRPAHYGSLAYILPIARDYHFGPIAKAEAVDIPFEQKMDRLVWRGSTYGSFTESRFLPLNGRSHISRLLAVGPDARLDIGYTNLVELSSKISPDYMALLKAAVRPRLSYKEQLQHKYILMLEGNDTATGMKWALNSNSLVVMPHPQYTTWVCEHLLKPFVHYIPVRRDLSDIPEMLDWCAANQDLCQEIIQNAKDFVAVFRDDDAQRRLGGKVLKEITRRTSFTYPY